jgi:hypothetical protein
LPSANTKFVAVSRKAQPSKLAKASAKAAKSLAAAANSLALFITLLVDVRLGERAGGDENESGGDGIDAWG